MHNPFVKEILRSYEKIRDHELKELEKRKQHVHSLVPRIKEIDEEISKTGMMVAKVILSNPQNHESALQDIKDKMDHLKQEKAILMTENNFPLTYLELNHQCQFCKDTGFLSEGQKCSCFKQRLINRAYEMSNMSKVLSEENFQSFNLDIFSDSKYKDEELSPKQNMQNILSIAEGFTINFDRNPKENLFFYGSTGLGKTFMCNCIAKSLLDKGKIVVYQTAFKILEILENYKFNNNRTADVEMAYQLLFDCDLLIIDDLGTELTNAFTNTEIFNIINSRLIQGKKNIDFYEPVSHRDCQYL